MKRPVILFELLISLSIMTVLITLLLRFFSNSVKIDHQIEEARSQLNTHEYLYTTLSTLFTSLISKSHLPPQMNSSFYTLDGKSQSLVAVFDHGIDPDPAFSGPIMSKLFLEHDNLILALWPLDSERGPYRKEILLSHVQSIEFQFLAKKDPQHPSAKPIGRTAEWRANWSKQQEGFPSLIRLTIKQGHHDLCFAFPLPVPEPRIMYGAV